MAFNSKLKDVPDFNLLNVELSVNPALYVNYGCRDASMDDNELRELFDQVLSFFLKEVSVKKNSFRPFPPKLGDGLEVDLLKLFVAVRRIGSYELVSENNMWEFVAHECGFEIGLVASLKLVYVMYLEELDQWLIEGKFKDNADSGFIEKLNLFSHQLDEIVGFKDERTLGFNQNDGVIILDDDDDEEFRVRDGKRCELSSDNVVKKVGVSMINDEVKRNDLSPGNVVKKSGIIMINDSDDDNDNNNDDVDEKQVEAPINIAVNEITRFHSDNNVTLTTKVNDVSNVERRCSLKRKKKKESLLLSEMLDWVANAARNPHDMIYKTSHRSLKWKNYTSGKLWKQALLSRKAIFAEINSDSGNDAKSSQKKNQRMHPGMYEDHKRVSLEVKRCCKSATSADQCTCPTCTLRISSRTKRPRIESGKFRNPDFINPNNKNYNLGPQYQAEVPPWTGVVSQSDPKWLGTQMWPPLDDISENHEKGSLVIGLGRESMSSCECMFSGSAECVRFHIAESRYKLKISLGDLFYKWKFNQMGEEVSLSWEPEEEKVFKSLVIKARHDLYHSNKSRHEIMNKFWKKGAYIIRDKTKKNLVSYYFNVFVLRRRSYQNRVTPKEIDSDNDEEEVGSVGDRFGYEKIHGVLLKCSENMQCRDLES